MLKNIDCEACPTMDCPVKQCESNWVNVINVSKNSVIYKKGQYIIKEGTPVYGLHFVQNGKVKIVSTDVDEKEQIVGLAKDGYILGPMYQDDEVHSIGAIALDNSVICFLNKDTLQDTMKNNYKFINHLVLFYSRELNTSELHIKYFAQMPVNKKIIFALAYIIETFGIDKRAKVIQGSFSRQDIAEIAGTNAEQVSRVIHFLKENNIIEILGNKILVKKYAALKKMIVPYTKGLS